MTLIIEQDKGVEKFSKSFLANLSYEPNEQQIQLIAELSYFCSRHFEESLFLLNGYAGTGKTSLTGALVKTLVEYNEKVVLLAPTGRAAKVFSEYSGHPAYTIHRKIYRQKSYSPEFGNYQLAENKHTNTLFIVDEASMIPNSSSEGTTFGTGNLLDDLMEYVYSGTNCRIIFLGDNAQLPPVGLDESPALDEKKLVSYGLKVYSFTLTKSARQAEESGILYNASILRSKMLDKVLEKPKIQFDGFADIINLSGEYLLETISDCYDRDGLNNTIIITRSNKRATTFNVGIRNQILYREDELVSGDMLLVAKNNYFWSKDYAEIDFIANGDVARVSRVKEVRKMYGFRFADVELEFTDRNVEMDARIILDALYSEAPSLTKMQNQQFYMEIMHELSGSQRERYKALKNDEFFNALQVKFAYAVTCHKAQGGQWKNVFIDMGYIPEDAYSNIDFHRWLYTAITRATDRVYLINCPF